MSDVLEIPSTTKLVGVVIDGIPVHDRELRGEKFNRILVDFNGTTIPVVFSEYIVKEPEITGKILVTGSLSSDVRRHKFPNFFFYASTIEPADEDAEPTNTVVFEATITKSKGFQQNRRGKDILPLIASAGNPIKGTSILYICLTDGAARKYKDFAPGMRIRGMGTFHPFKDVYEIYAQEVIEVS